MYDHVISILDCVVSEIELDETNLSDKGCRLGVGYGKAALIFA